jgi:hypothetical protein
MRELLAFLNLEVSIEVADIDRVESSRIERSEGIKSSPDILCRDESRDGDATKKSADQTYKAHKRTLATRLGCQ